MGIKTGDETCYPACGPHHDVEGCHETIGRRMSREHRRQLELEYARRARARLRPICERRGILLPPENSIGD